MNHLSTKRVNTSVLSQTSSEDVAMTANLQFPKLIQQEGGSWMKRGSIFQSYLPAKRPKLSKTGLQFEATEDDSWIDNFFLPESMLPDEEGIDSLAIRPSPYAAGSRACDSSVLRTEPTEGSLQVQPTVIPPCCDNTDYSVFKSSCKTIPVGETASLLNSQAATAAVAPFLPLHHIPEIKETGQDRLLGCPLVQSFATPANADFTVESLQHSLEPTLLTLTSFPYRVVYANNAYDWLSGGKSIIGTSMFESFTSKDMPEPSLALSSTLLDRFQHEESTVKVARQGRQSSSSKDDELYCKVRAFPVTKDNESNSLRCYAIRFYELG